MKRDAMEGTMYPVILTPDDNDTVMARFVDFPGATYGANAPDAMNKAREMLMVIIASYIEDRKDIPGPSLADGRPTVALRMLGSLKVAIYQEMRKRGWRKADLARELKVNPRQIDRLLDLWHASPLAQLEAAFAALGKDAQVQVVERAA